MSSFHAETTGSLKTPSVLTGMYSLTFKTSHLLADKTIFFKIDLVVPITKSLSIKMTLLRLPCSNLLAV